MWRGKQKNLIQSERGVHAETWRTESLTRQWREAGAEKERRGRSPDRKEHGDLLGLGEDPGGWAEETTLKRDYVVSSYVKCSVFLALHVYALGYLFVCLNRTLNNIYFVFVCVCTVQRPNTDNSCFAYLFYQNFICQS